VPCHGRENLSPQPPVETAACEMSRHPSRATNQQGLVPRAGNGIGETSARPCAQPRMRPAPVAGPRRRCEPTCLWWQRKSSSLRVGCWLTAATAAASIPHRAIAGAPVVAAPPILDAVPPRRAVHTGANLAPRKLCSLQVDSALLPAEADTPSHPALGRIAIIARSLPGTLQDLSPRLCMPYHSPKMPPGSPRLQASGGTAAC